MASIDQIAVNEYGVTGLFLMEKAGECVTTGLLSAFPSDDLKHIAILCGKGNNGGDGFVIARHLAKHGFIPSIALIGSPDTLKGDAKINYTLLAETGISVWICSGKESIETFFNSAKHCRVWIDALLGTGTKGSPSGLILDAIQLLNLYGKKNTIVSVDISSGVDANTGEAPGAAVQSDIVYTMGLPKAGHVLPPGLNYYKDLVVLDIGFPRNLLLQAESEAELLTDSSIDAVLPHRSRSAHKGSEGHLLTVSGSRGMTGAALLCSKAAIQTGAGLVTAVAPASLLPVYAGGVWEMLTLPAAETARGSIALEAFDTIFKSETKYSALVIGPGLSRDPSSMNLVRRVVKEIPCPVVIDGDALFAIRPEMLLQRTHPWIITPHPGEMARLFEVGIPEIQNNRWSYARRLAQTPAGVVVLKGPKTVIASDNKLFINPTGGPFMASGGMGDVLAGIIGALAAKGLSCFDAAKAGVFLHGRAADLCSASRNAEAVYASQVIDFIQDAIFSARENSLKNP